MQEPDPPLHEAAKAGNADKVKTLLEGGADPCQADSKGKVPYDLAADKAVRDAFRRYEYGSCQKCCLVANLEAICIELRDTACLVSQQFIGQQWVSNLLDS